MTRAALYARVSSDRQEHEETIQSQLGELRAHVQEDGVVDCQEFIDESYARDNLVRPGLDRLRDLVAQGEVEHLYVQHPDRLAGGAKLVLLVEEFQQHGVEVVFLKGSVEDTPEGKLLLHMQGAIAEYERTKIMERTRRGKLYWARHGAIVGGHAPCGYRFVRRTDTRRAHLEVDDSQAVVVREMYHWLVEEHMSTRAIAKRLTERDIPTAGSAAQWQPTVVDRILRNPVNKGEFLYYRAERVLPSRRRSTDPYRQNRKNGRKPRPPEEWITIPVPPIVDAATWQQAQEQLRQNSVYSQRNNKRHQYLLRGLIRCPRCGATYTGAARNGRRRYRCTREDASVSSTGKRCLPGSFLAEPVEEAVWEAVKEALQQPQVLVEEYKRRLAHARMPDALEAERKQVALALKRVKAQEDRITDAYVNEAMELDRYKAEMQKLRQRREELERAAQDIERRERQEQDSCRALERLERFCRQVAQGLEAMTFEERQQLLRLVVERITVEDGRVRIETVIPTGDGGVQLRARHPERSEGSHLNAI
ncbi:MAG: recombinase family protein [Chloroflexi bacterium]|nr:recombinase family protein [Chloroflexota bacterium]